MTRLTAYVSALVALDLALFSAIVPLLPQLSDQLDLTKVQSGLLLGAYSGAVLVTAVPIGHLADRLGMRNVNVAGSLLVCAATAAFAVGSSFELLFAPASPRASDRPSPGARGWPGWPRAPLSTAAGPASRSRTPPPPAA